MKMILMNEISGTNDRKVSFGMVRTQFGKWFMVSFFLLAIVWRKKMRTLVSLLKLILEEVERKRFCSFLFLA